ncbi:MAG TPA: hypothetical protein VF183_02255 [Acidimicrobiales bacterium]
MSEIRRRPAGVSDAVVAGVGKASEAFEYIIRARGHLYSMHQLIGRADFLLEDAAELLAGAGCEEDAQALRDEVVGRNVLDGRWTFQIVEEFDELYYRVVEDTIMQLEQRLLGGRRHLYEAEMKDARRSPGRLGHEARPRAAYLPFVEIEPE